MVLNVTYRCRPGRRDEFLRAITDNGIAAASRAEEGNIRYDYFIPADGGDELFLLEKWRDAAAVADHRGRTHFARLGELKSAYVLDTAIEQYEL